VTRKQDNRKGKITAEELRKMLAEDRDLLKVIVEETRQQVLEAEMDEALQACKSERTASRLGYRAGYYNRTLATRVGHIELRVPQDRQGRFRTEVFERYQRSEKALVAAMLKMYIQGVSTRAKVHRTHHVTNVGAYACRNIGQMGYCQSVVVARQAIPRQSFQSRPEQSDRFLLAEGRAC
jgi:transposase-like protein